ATGRPLVWMTECIEHAVVAKISDFIFIRPFVLAVVLATVVYVGRVLGSLIGSRIAGTLAATLFVMAPGYSFMYLQGGPALMVLIAPILAAASFDSLRKRLDAKPSSLSFFVLKLWLPCLLFLAACMIYPIWAFLVVPLAFIAFAFDDIRPLRERAARLIVVL